MSANIMLDNLKEWFDNPENAKHFEDMLQKEFYREERWIERFHAYGKDKRKKLIYAAIKKYESDKYKDDEYVHHKRMPSNSLYFDVFLPYAQKYGKVLQPDEMFMIEKYEFDDYWIIELYIGQGSEIHIYPKECDKKDFYLNRDIFDL